jgi:nicotinamide-nucleotide amidase
MHDPFHAAIAQLAEDCGKVLLEHRLMVATAESCTAGMVAAALTSIAGSSDWFERGFVTYSNAAKSELLNVPAELIKAQGAVSEAVATAMVNGALLQSRAALAVSVTGIAGPAGGTPQKPVGTVCLAWGANTGWRRVATFHFKGDRHAVRSQSVVIALEGLLEAAAMVDIA